MAKKPEKKSGKKLYGVCFHPLGIPYISEDINMAKKYLRQMKNRKPNLSWTLVEMTKDGKAYYISGTIPCEAI